MIFSLEGLVSLRALAYVVVDVVGVGYKVFVGSETLGRIPGQGQKIKIFTSLYKRETEIELYGFMTVAELEFFETLKRISGIGPKSALGILNVAPLDTIKRAIASGQTSYLTKVSGIGKKTAEKVVLELRDKLGKGADESEGMGADEDVINALQALGYSLKESRDAIYTLDPAVKGAEARLKAALKFLGKS